MLYRLDRDWHFPQINLLVPSGAISVGFFWEHKPFNLYHWMTPAGQTIGDYFNLAAETFVTSTRIEWLDLVLDLCLIPGRDWFWLDEHELPAYLETSLRRQLEQGRRDLSIQAAQLSRHLGRLSRMYLARIDSLPIEPWID